MTAKILIKRGTATQWSASTTPLASGELGLDTTNNILKAGNGTDLWANLNPIVLTSSQVDELARDAIGSALVGGSGISVNVNDAADSITVSVDNTIATKSYTDTAISNLVDAAPATLDTLNELAAALGDDANFATTVTTSLADKVSKSGGDTITASTAATIPLTIQAASSQSAFLLSWQNSSGTNLGRIDQSGNIRFSANTFSQLNAGNGSGLFIPSSATVVPLAVKGYTSQTGNLQEWQNSAGNIIARITSDGGILSSTFVTGGTASPGTNLGAITAYPVNTSTVGIVIKGFASQTADLQQWQNSSGTVLSAITSNGSMAIGRSSNLGSASFTIQSVTPISLFSTDNTTALHNRIIFLRGNSTGNSMSITSKGDTANGVGALVISTGAFTTEITGFGYNGNIYTNIQTASTVGLTVKGAASQTANLTEWQNSSGTTKGSIGPNGELYVTGLSTSQYSEVTAYGVLYFGGNVNNTKMTVVPNTASHVGIVIKAAASQTANLQEWQNSAGSVLSSINSSGRILASSGIYTTGAQVGDFYNSPGGNIAVINSGASQVGINVKGHGSQTANLQQWMNSAGTVLASIIAGGNIRGFAGLYGTNTADTSSYPLYVTNSVASTVVAVIKGATSQTANLQEWQDSSGTVLASVNASGKFVGDGSLLTGISGLPSQSGNSGKYLTTDGTNASWGIINVNNIVSISSSSVALIVKGASSQTADLQQWQNNAGTVLVNVTSEGVLNAPIVTNAQTGTTYTFSLSDAGKLVEFSNTSTITVTVPPNSSVAYSIGTQINLLATNTGQVTIVGGSGVTVNATPGLNLRTQWSSATLIKRGTDTWVLVGDVS